MRASTCSRNSAAGTRCWHWPTPGWCFRAPGTRPQRLCPRAGLFRPPRGKQRAHTSALGALVVQPAAAAPGAPRRRRRRQPLPWRRRTAVDRVHEGCAGGCAGGGRWRGVRTVGSGGCARRWVVGARADAGWFDARPAGASTKSRLQTGRLRLRPRPRLRQLHAPWWASQVGRATQPRERTS